MFSLATGVKGGRSLAHRALDAGRQPVHDALTRIYRHLTSFQRQYVLVVRTPQLKLPYVPMEPVTPPFAVKLSGFTLLF